MSAGVPPSRRAVAFAGHTGDVLTARTGLVAPDPRVRATAIGALERLAALTDIDLRAALADDSPLVRRRAAEIAARHPSIDLAPLLDDSDPTVVEMAAWSAGEHEDARNDIVDRLIARARDHADPLVREAAVAALGAIGAESGRAAILTALDDKPAIRRRAVLALAPFTGPDVDAALDRALADRDWQVRQAAEELRRAIGG